MGIVEREDWQLCIGIPIDTKGANDKGDLETYERGSSSNTFAIT